MRGYSFTFARVRLITAVFLGIAACRSSVPAHPGDDPPLLSFVFSAEQTRQSIRNLQRCAESSLSEVTRTWTPRATDVKPLESELIRSLALAISDTEMRNRAREYRFQYFGIVRNGRRLIFVNGFHQILLRNWPSDRWIKEAVVPCDVRYLRFQAEFNVEAQHLSRLRFDEG
jgi:hypothetical protein